MPSESDDEELFPSFPVTSNRKGKYNIITYICCHLHVMLTVGATKTEKDSGESSAAASKTKHYVFF